MECFALEITAVRVQGWSGAKADIISGIIPVVGGDELQSLVAESFANESELAFCCGI